MPRAIALLNLFVLLIWSSTGVAAEPLKVFILAGQSNMVGWGDSQQLPEPLQTGNGRVVMFESGTWQPLRPFKKASQNQKKYGMNAFSFGPEIAFAHEMARARPDETIGIVKFAVGGSSILTWKPDWSEADANRVRQGRFGSLYKKLMAKVREAGQARDIEIEGFVWVQGGGDMKDVGVAQEYLDNLKALVAAVRKDTGLPDLPFYCGSVRRADDAADLTELVPKKVNGPYPAVEYVLKAQWEGQQQIPNFRTVILRDIETHPMNVHYNTVGQLAVGKLFAKAVLHSGSGSGGEIGSPVSILAARIGGHVHPSICRTQDGTLIVVYKGDNVLMCSRSTDDGTTWSTPEPIETSATRPDAIRQVERFEVYPGTVDTLPDDRVLVTWNYIADDKARDGYYERALLYTVSTDQGRTWSDQKLIGPIDGKHLGAVRHNVLPWGEGSWLLPLRVGPPRLFDPLSEILTPFPLVGPDGKQHEFQQVIRTARGTLLAMGPVLLHSADDGRHWSSIDGFPAAAEQRDNREGRFLTALSDGRVLVTWGVGHDNQGLRYNLSSDDGQTWNGSRTVTLLPTTNIAARYYSARTIQLDSLHVGTVFMNGDGVHFLKVRLARLSE